MPYIIMKRDDVPAATLQVLDLDPNTSLRNYTLDVPGQTKYINPAQNETVVGFIPTAMELTTFRDARGLAAWFITNAPSGGGVAATAAFTIAAGNAADGDTVTIGTSPVGGPDVTLTFRTAPSTIFEVLIGATADASASNLAGVVNNLPVGLAPYVNGSFGGSGTGDCDITAVQDGVAGNAITLAETSANISAPATLATGVNAVPMTFDEANADAQDVLDLLAFGDLTAAAGVLTVAAINGALTAGFITAAQLPDVLDILAGREYFVPAGTLVADAGVFEISPAVGTANGPRFIAATNRTLFLNDGLTLSVATGELEGYLDTGFIYSGVAGDPNGEAVAVYNDDGTIFTP
jgi:hypothetical protein